MDENKIMTSVTNGLCPHCSKSIMISSKAMLPSVNWVLKPEDIDEARESLKKKIAESKLDDKTKAEVTAWIDRKEVMFGPAEVEPLFQQVLAQEELEAKKE